MNLIKLFNPAYLKENIKKSRGFILLFLILVPLFTALMTILEINGNSSVSVANDEEIALINIIGMYVIPFILSFTLFGYVYKRNSVDFVNSMPLNRKTIFVTNTIGGILLITIMQFLTAMILVICDALLVNVVIFTKMISEIFILMWISYVFVFIATNLAMTLSGTFLTQVALTLLILFLVPFCIDSFNEFSSEMDCTFISGESEFVDSVYEKEVFYTMPYGIFNMLFSGNYDGLYSTNSVIRMIVLGVLYFVIGMYLFQKRKMENTEESFSSIKMHIGVKALTMLPMIILLNLVEPDVEFVIFAIALISVYYFIFDFIVKRKVSLKVSIPSLIAILIGMEVICLGAGFIRDNLPMKTLNRDDVKAVSIGNCRNYSSGSWYYYRDLFAELGYYFEEQEIIDLIFESANYVQEMYQANRIEENVKNEEVTVEQIAIPEDIKIVDSYKEYEKTSVVSVTFKMKSGKELKTDLEILEVDFDKLIEIFEKDENYVSAVKERFIHEGEYTIQNELCDDKTQEIIKSEIKTKLKDMPLKEIYTTLRSTDNCAIYQYYYENHKLITNTVSVTITENLFNIATELLNKKAVQVVKDALEEDLYAHFYVEIPEKESEQYINYSGYPEAISRKYTGYSDFNEEVIMNFILKNEDEKVDFSKEYYILRGNVGKYGSVYFYTNKTEEIIKMILSEGIHEVVY